MSIAVEVRSDGAEDGDGDLKKYIYTQFGRGVFSKSDFLNKYKENVIP